MRVLDTIVSTGTVLSAFRITRMYLPQTYRKHSHDISLKNFCYYIVLKLGFSTSVFLDDGIKDYGVMSTIVEAITLYPFSRSHVFR